LKVTLVIFLRSIKFRYVDVEGGVGGDLASIVVKGKTGGTRGRKSCISQAQEWAQLEVHLGKQLSIEGVVRVSQTPWIFS